jgi:hypothetical protein
MLVGAGCSLSPNHHLSSLAASRALHGARGTTRTHLFHSCTSFLLLSAHFLRPASWPSSRRGTARSSLKWDCCGVPALRPRRSRGGAGLENTVAANEGNKSRRRSPDAGTMNPHGAHHLGQIVLRLYTIQMRIPLPSRTWLLRWGLGHGGIESPRTLISETYR